MNEMAHVEENLRVSADDVSLTDGDRARIEGRMGDLKKMAELYCTSCQYCMPCPANVAIASVFHSYSRGRVYGLWDAARTSYGHIGAHDGGESKQADACTDCGACEEKCPHNIPIRRQLAEAHETLAGQPAQ